MDKEILVLGIGNILQMDDGIGVHIVNYIVESGIQMPDDVDVVDGGTAGFDLIPLMQNRKKIIIVDALKVNDKPGSIYRFTPDHIIETARPFTLHEVGIKSVLRMLEFLGEKPVIEIIGIVPEDIDTFDIGISSSVKESIPRAVEQILNATIH